MMEMYLIMQWNLEIGYLAWGNCRRKKGNKI